jgi:hypothetical protein
MITKQQVLASLNKHGPYLQDAVHEDLANGIMADCGGIQAAKLNPLKAAKADPVKNKALEYALGQARRMQVDVEIEDSGYVDQWRLNKVLAGKSISDRMRLKDALSAAGLLVG